MDNKKFEKLMILKNSAIEENDICFIRDCLMDSDVIIRSEAVSIMINAYTTDNDIYNLIGMCSDDKELVRIEVYDALSQCNGNEVTECLFNAINSETSDLARCFAIISWADVIANHASKYKDYSDDIDFIMSLLKKQEISDSEHCQLSCWYALYRFGYPALEKILSFLDSEDYTIQCSVINHLMYVVRKSDIARVKNRLELLKKKNPPRAVSSLIYDFLRKYR